MFGRFIPAGQRPTNGVIAGSQPAPRLTGEQYPVKQPSRDFGAVIHVPRPDRVARSLLDAIF